MLGSDAMLPITTLQEVAGSRTRDTQNDQANLLQQLTTESQNEASQGLDTKSALEIARIINHEDAKIAAAVKKAIPEIAQVIDQVARSLRDGGRLIYVGAGSSGRIAALDSSECPPTYSSAPGQVRLVSKTIVTAASKSIHNEHPLNARCPTEWAEKCLPADEFTDGVSHPSAHELPSGGCRWVNCFNTC